MAKSHSEVLLRIIAHSLKKPSKAYLLVTDRKMSRWQQSKDERDGVHIFY
ncbi:hypothetical protein SARI_03599 [Salmonella enterica subsp. arizonae serovar 62:z4,z23:-]|uniref:Uncharacterized protein n=1 Tax=Salmonella arizonae (strain ATCC BAA-731 / CDC346-86 / RSK2980) TaxID=41514 RepID=A9MI65_SALAR|nr:hypothetical protein SARI_03599 [Salmonella enterica subsp. arizonae serovar 62:z4,z23:-]